MQPSSQPVTSTALFTAEAKAAYIAARDISVTEVVEVLGNAPRFFVRRNPESSGDQYAMLGRTVSGRYLTVAIEQMDEGEGVWRLITADPLNPRRGRRLYEGA